MSDDEWFVSFYQPATKPTTHIALVIHPMIYKYPILYSYSGLRLIVVINIHQYPIKRWMEESFAPVDDVTNPIDIGCQPSRCRTYSIHSITTAGPFPMILSMWFGLNLCQVQASLARFGLHLRNSSTSHLSTSLITCHQSPVTSQCDFRLNLLLASGSIIMRFARDLKTILGQINWFKGLFCCWTSAALPCKNQVGVIKFGLKLWQVQTSLARPSLNLRVCSASHLSPVTIKSHQTIHRH